MLDYYIINEMVEFFKHLSAILEEKHSNDSMIVFNNDSIVDMTQRGSCVVGPPNIIMIKKME